MNDLSALSSKLAVALRDTAHETWNSTEKDALIEWAVRSLYPQVAVPLSLPIYPLTADTENYSVPTGIREVYRVEVGEVATDRLLRVLDDGTWYTYGDPLAGTLSIFVNKQYSDPAHYYIVHGYGSYNIASGEIPDALVPRVIATARAEAYRRMLGERSRFEQWQASSHEQDVTVNELLALVAEAQADAARLSVPRTHRRPVPGRLSS